MSLPNGSPGLRDLASAREGWAARTRRLLTGDDVFISYARRDAGPYALALADQLTRAGMSCFLDQWGTEPRTTLPDGLKRALLRSGVLVVIASPGAGESPFVAEEVAMFRRLERPIVPVDVGGAGEWAAWWPQVQGVARTPETLENLAAGRPHEEVVRRIAGTVGFRSRRRRLRRGLVTTMVGAALMLGIATGATVVARRQQQRTQALSLANQAAELVDTDPAGALRLALTSLDVDDNLPAHRVLSSVLEHHPRLIRALGKGTAGSVTWVAFTPDGALLAASAPVVTRFWDAHTGRELPPLPPDSTLPLTAQYHFAFGFTPDGRWLVSGGPFGMSVRRVSDRSLAAVLDTQPGVAMLATGPDGWIAVREGVQDSFPARRTVRLLRVDAAGRLRQVDSVVLTRAAPVESLAFDPRGGTLAIGTRDAVHLVDLQTASVRRVVRPPPDQRAPGHLTFAPDGRYLMGLTLEGKVAVWETRSWSALVPSPYASAADSGPSGRVLATGPDGLLLTGGESGLVQALAPAASRDLVGTWPAEQLAVAVSPNGRTFATGGSDGVVAMWSAEGSRRLRYDVHPTIQVPITMDARGRRFLVHLDGGGVGVWDVERHKAFPLDRRGEVRAMDATGTRVALAWRDTLVVYTLGPGGAVAGAPVVTGFSWVGSVRMSGDGRYVAVWGDGGYFVWDVKAGRSVGSRVIAGAPGFRPRGLLAVSPDGLLATADAAANGLYLVDLAAGKPMRALIHDGALVSGAVAAVFTRGGRELLSFDGDGLVLRWRPARDGWRATVVDTVMGMRVHATTWQSSNAMFSADGHLLAVQVDDRPPFVWDLTRRGLLTSAGTSGHMALSGDGSRLVLGNDSAAAYAVDLSTTALVLAACSILVPDSEPVAPTRDRVERACRRRRSEADGHRDWTRRAWR